MAEAKQIVTNFIWEDKPPKIAYAVLTQSIQNGEMKLIDFQSKALMSSFVKRLLDESNGKWKTAAAYFLKTNKLKLYFNTNQTKNDSIHHKLYADAHSFWTDLQQIDKPTSPVMKNQVIWENKYITIANKPLCWQNWLQNGIVCVQDLLGENGGFLSHEEINHKYGLRCNFLNVLQLRHSLPYEWCHIINLYRTTERIVDAFIPIFGQVMPLSKCTTIFFYDQFLGKSW